MQFFCVCVCVFCPGGLSILPTVDRLRDRFQQGKKIHPLEKLLNVYDFKPLFTKLLYDQSNCYFCNELKLESCHVNVDFFGDKVVHSFSPVWERLCLLRSLDLEKALEHWVQANGFSPV